MNPNHTHKLVLLQEARVLDTKRLETWWYVLSLPSLPPVGTKIVCSGGSTVFEAEVRDVYFDEESGMFFNRAMDPEEFDTESEMLAHYKEHGFVKERDYQKPVPASNLHRLVIWVEARAKDTRNVSSWYFVQHLPFVPRKGQTLFLGERGDHDDAWDVELKEDPGWFTTGGGHFFYKDTEFGEVAEHETEAEVEKLYRQLGFLNNEEYTALWEKPVTDPRLPDIDWEAAEERAPGQEPWGLIGQAYRMFQTATRRQDQALWAKATELLEIAFAKHEGGDDAAAVAPAGDRGPDPESPSVALPTEEPLRDLDWATIQERVREGYRAPHFWRDFQTAYYLLEHALQRGGGDVLPMAMDTLDRALGRMTEQPSTKTPTTYVDMRTPTALQD